MTAGAIIAGGHARRLGGIDKSRLQVDGSSIIARQLTVLRSVTSEQLIVVGHHAQLAKFAALGVPIHADRIPGAGVVGGIHTALDVAGADAVITIGCDLPFLPAGLLQQLIELAAQGDGAWVVGANGPEPLIACYRQHARDVIRQQIDLGHFKAANLGHVLDMRPVDLAAVARFGPPARLLANINTPEDCAAYNIDPP